MQQYNKNQQINALIEYLEQNI